MAAAVSTFVALSCDGHTLSALDQTELPWHERQLSLTDAASVAQAIRRLAIRGAPLIGVAAGYAVAIELARKPTLEALERACDQLTGARPTAVNLAAAVLRVRAAVLAGPIENAAGAALAEARAIEAEELAASDAIAAYGADLIPAARRVLTHCNSGALAAPGRGTALAIVAELAARGGLEEVLVTESRPLLQGARLTTYELARRGIRHRLLVDSAAAGVIAAERPDAVLVGCDRVAANGDVANKVGTYGLALAARAAGVPMIVAGPTSTIDFATRSGAEIVIEQRAPHEVLTIGATAIAAAATPCLNPAFDVTPAALVSALVTEMGVARPVDADSVAALRRGAR
jgi:S-methyl-5-thioribose-1-phosphate isomerase